MSLIDNIENVAFASQYPIDKIVQIITATSSVIPAAATAAIPENYDATLAHTAGAETIVSGMFSLDNTNYYPLGAIITGSLSGSGVLQSMYAEAYNDEDTIYLKLAQGFESSQTVYVYFYMESIA